MSKAKNQPIIARKAQNRGVITELQGLYRETILCSVTGLLKPLEGEFGKSPESVKPDTASLAMASLSYCELPSSNIGTCSAYLYRIHIVFSLTFHQYS